MNTTIKREVFMNTTIKLKKSRGPQLQAANLLIVSGFGLLSTLSLLLYFLNAGSALFVMSH